REPPKATGLPQEQVSDGFTAADGRRDWRLLAICGAFLLAAAGISGVVGQLVPLLSDRGVSAGTATSLLGLYAISSAAARLLSGFILDRVFAPLIGAIVFLGGAAG